MTTTTTRYDLVVLGAGPAGEKAATQAAYFGKRVAIIEKRPNPGGIAVSDAGIPTKTLRETAVYLTGFRHREVYGISLSLTAGLKLERLLSRTAEVQAIMTEAARNNISRMGIDLLHGTGRLLAPAADGHPRVAVVDDERGGERILDAEVALIATGSRPIHPPGIPWGDPGVADSERILKLDKLPRSLVVIGGGAIGCEYASIFTALGVQVTLVEATDRVLAFVDGEISRRFVEIFTQLGTRVILGTPVEKIERAPGVGGALQIRLGSGETLAPDQVLFAGGRIGNTEGIGLAEAGVEVDARGRIRVDGTYRTTAANVYAAGDVIGPPALASVSMEQGRVATCNAFHIPFKDVVDPLAPIGIYSVPEVAMVGITEETAKFKGIDYEVGRCPFSRNTRARIAGATEGLIKLVFRRSDRVLLGVHIIGDVAAELIHLGQVVASHGRPIDYFIHATFNVPTYSEAYKYAAYDGLQRLKQA